MINSSKRYEINVYINTKLTSEGKKPYKIRNNSFFFVVYQR